MGRRSRARRAAGTLPRTAPRLRAAERPPRRAAERRAPEGAVAPVPARRAVRARRDRADRARAVVGSTPTAAGSLLVVRLALGSLGGLDTAVREHFAGYSSHSLVLAGVPAVAVAARAVLRPRAVDRGRGRRAGRRARRLRASAPRPRRSGGLSCRAIVCRGEPRQQRMQLRGLHHVTAICRDLERTIAFYRDLLGLAIVHDGPSRRRSRARATCGSARSTASRARCVSFMEYPELPQGRGRRRLDAPLRARRRLGRGAGGVARLPARAKASSAPTSSTAGAFRSIYLRDPDGHIVEIATRGPGFGAGPRVRLVTAASVARGPVVERERIHVASARSPRSRPRARAAGARSSSRRSSSPTSGSRQGTAGSESDPSGAGSSADRRWPCSRPPRGTRAPRRRRTSRHR